MFAQIILHDNDYKLLDTGKLQKGDLESHNHLYRILFKTLCANASEVLIQPHKAANLVNYAFIKYWLRSDNLPTIEEVVAFLYVTTRNNCFACNKREPDYRSPHEPLLQEILAETVRDGFSRPELLAHVNQYLNGDRALAKGIFDWRYGRHLAVQQIAKEIDSPIAIIKEKEHLALQMLHLILSTEPCSNL